MPVLHPGDRDLIALAAQVIAAYTRAGQRVATAESCTGGLISACLTEVPGSSAVLERGYVTYSNLAKEQDLGVPVVLLTQHGAVSAETAAAMAEGALTRSPAEVAVAVTGIAGPAGGTADKPVGLVYLAVARREGRGAQVERHLFAGGRAEIRYTAVRRALELLLSAAPDVSPGEACR